MPIQTINLGNYANDGSGDDLRTAFQKVNSNFELVGSTLGIINGENLGSGVGIFKRRDNDNLTLEFKSLTSTDNSVEITANPDGNTVNLKNNSLLENDPSPSLTADLELNGNNIVVGSEGYGDVQTTVWGIDVRNVNGILEMLIQSGSVTLDFGSFVDGTTDIPDAPTNIVDMNGNIPDFLGFSVPDPSGINLNFGSIA
jgi:hypothetical protein